SGLAEPLGALIGFLILRPYISPTIMGLVFAFVAGIMVFISLDELFPAAKEYGKGHLAIYALIAGMLIMALTLLMLM
ncbi:MAG: zinc transporter ZupT, partial [Desulfonatronovibrio sp.]